MDDLWLARQVGKAAGGDQSAIGRHGERIDFTRISGRDRHADRAQELAVPQIPDPDRLVVRAGDHKPLLPVDVDPLDRGRMHAGLDRDHRLAGKVCDGGRRGDQTAQPCR
jgi:hypothetical protein